MKNPKISIVVPVYNVERYVKECFKSIDNQSFRGGVIECVFVDDCGQDDSITILEELIANYKGDIQFSLIHHEHNKGLSAARNTGIRHAKGNYLYFLDSDDTITPDCIKNLAALAEKYSGVEVVLSDFVTKNPYVLLNGDTFPEYSDNFNWIRKNFLKHRFPSTATNKLIKRDFIIKYELYFREGVIHEDTLWNFFCGKYVNNIAFCRAKTYIYRENPQSIMHTADLATSYIPIMKIMAANITQPYAIQEITQIMDKVGEDVEVSEVCIQQMTYNKRTLRQLFHLKATVNKTRICSLQGFVARVCYHILAWFVNLTYPTNRK